MPPYTSPTQYLGATGLSQTELNAPGGMNTTQGGVRSGYNPAPVQPTTPVAPVVSAPAPAPAIGTAPQPGGAMTSVGFETPDQTIARVQANRYGGDTVGQTLGGFDTGGYEEVYQPTPFDEAGATREATRNQMKLYQAQIDATNQVYDQLLNEARVQGTGRLGSQRAGAARGGLLGSDFANSQKATVQDFNTQEQRGIGAERTAAIGNIMGKVRQSALDEVAAKRAARTAGADEYMDFLSRRGERRDNFKSQLVNDAITQGFDLTQLSEEELGEYLGQSGISASDLLASYQTARKQSEAAGAEADLETRKTEAEIDKIEADIAEGRLKTIGEGTMLYNTKTGEMVKNPKTYKPTAPSGLSIGAGVLDQQSVADVHATLNESRGADGYTDTGLYMDEFNGFVAAGGDPKDFVKEYDPNIYINPNDPTRSFLQTEMKKTVDQDISEAAKRQQLIDSYSAVLNEG